MNETTKLLPIGDLITQLGTPINDHALLELALTHRSYLNENPEASADNERLEFLGDAVIDFIVGAYLYRRYPDMREGEMTSLRAALVRAETLAQFAQQLTIDQHLRLGWGEDESGGRKKIPTLCATFEAVIGALYLDQGIDAATQLIESLSEPMLVIIIEQSLHKDAKSEFQVWAQAEHGITPRYVVLDAIGPDHAKIFKLQVCVGDAVWGEGEGTSKRRAAQAAAQDGLDRVAAIQLDDWEADE